MRPETANEGRFCLPSSKMTSCSAALKRLRTGDSNEVLQAAPSCSGGRDSSKGTIFTPGNGASNRHSFARVTPIPAATRASWALWLGRNQKVGASPRVAEVRIIACCFRQLKEKQDYACTSAVDAIDRRDRNGLFRMIGLRQPIIALSRFFLRRTNPARCFNRTIQEICIRM